MRATKHRLSCLVVVLGALSVGCLCSQAVQAQSNWGIGYTGSMVIWTVPSDNSYTITAYGAQGGDATGISSSPGSASGGLGAIISGDVYLTAGSQLSILVGGVGTSGTAVGGGGGGSFVVESATNALVVAGGGGGAYAGNNGYNATTTTNGGNGNEQLSVLGGSDGYGGQSWNIGSSLGTFYGGGGGGGFIGNGYSGATSSNPAAGGSSFLNGGSGGYNSQNPGPSGGFGGGGQANGFSSGPNQSAGGGGGYSGGGSGGSNSSVVVSQGGGGGSYIVASASNAAMSVGNYGNGWVSIAFSPLLMTYSINSAITFTTGTSTYSNILVGGYYFGNQLTVTDVGTLVTSESNVVVGEYGYNNSMVVSAGATVVTAPGTYTGAARGGIIGYANGAHNNTVTVTGSGSAWNNAYNVIVGLSGSGNGMVVSDGGTVVTNSGTYTGPTNGGVIGYNASASNNAVTVTGSGSAWNNAYNVIVGYGGSGNSLLVSSGGAVTAGNTAYSATMGYDAGSSNNSVTVTGSGSTFSNNSVLVGVSGTGNSMVVSAGGRVLTGGGGSYIGTGSTSLGNSVLVTGTGSEWTNGSFLFVGDLGSGNSLTVSDGGSVTAGVVDVGYSPGNAGNSVVVSGGGSISSDSTYIGRYGSSNSVLVTGSGSTWTNTSSAPLYIGFGGTASSLTVADGGSVSAAQTRIGTSCVLNIGRFGTSDAAGTLSSPTIAFGTGSGRINFNQSDTTTISSAISGTGSLYQLGSGTTILTGHNTYTGTTVVQNGTLLVEGQGGLGDVAVSAGGAIGGSGSLGGSLFLDSGAKVLFHQSRPLTVNGASVTFGGFDIGDLVGLDGTVPLGAYTIINGAAAIDFSNLAHVGESNAYEIGGGKRAFFSSGSLIVNIVPEPATYAMAFAGLACGGFSMWRRRKRA